MMDKARFEEIYGETAVKLRRYVDNMIGRCSRVEDITQEAYLRMLTSAPERLSNRQLKSYLFTTATNIIRDSWRRGAVAGEWMPLDDEYAASPHNAETAASDIDLSKILNSMSIMQKSLLWLAYAEGYTHREIAAITGIKEKSVKVLLFRARQKFISVFHERNSALDGKLQ